MASLDVSVIVITKNESEVIEQCLTSSFNQSLKPLEVIVVDGRSTDDTLRKASQFPVKILVEREPTSPSNARNLGVQNSKGEVMLIMGADTRLDRDCLKNAIKYFQDENIIVVIPSQEVEIHTYLEKIQANWFYGTRNPIRSTYGAGSSINFVRRNVYNAVKFDPSLGYGDDGDFRRRLRKQYKSGKILKAPDSKVFIDIPHSFAELLSQYTWYGRTFLKYFSKYPFTTAFFGLCSLLMPAIFLIICFTTIILPATFPLVIIVLVPLMARNIIACYRSKSLHLFEFILFEFARSLFFVYGIIQGFFVKKIGR